MSPLNKSEIVPSSIFSYFSLNLLILSSSSLVNSISVEQAFVNISIALNISFDNCGSVWVITELALQKTSKQKRRSSWFNFFGALSVFVITSTVHLLSKYVELSLVICTGHWTFPHSFEAFTKTTQLSYKAPSMPIINSLRFNLSNKGFRPVLFRFLEIRSNVNRLDKGLGEIIFFYIYQKKA